MFSQHTTCPRCHTDISDERRSSVPTVCDNCGHVLSTAEAKAEETLTKNYKYGMFGFAAFVVGFHLFFSAWGGYTFEVRWIQLFGGNSAASQERMAQICIETFQYDCAEQAYLAVARQDSKAFLKLGKFQMSRQNYAGAAQSFKQYLAANEDVNFDVSYLLARSLSETGQVDEASDLYETIIRAKTDILQVTVIQKYVELLMKHQRWAQAQKIIQEIRKRGEAVADFMGPQYTEITAKLGGSKS